jgi:tetratricopeptide (TPR) repeat protein
MMLATQANKLVDKEPTPEFEEQCKTVFRQWSTGKMAFRDAVEHLAALAQRAVEQAHVANLGRVEHLLGYIQHDRGNLNTSIMHFERARSMFEQVGNWQRVAMMDLNLGEAYRYKGDLTRARFLFHKAYESANMLNLLEIKTLAIANEGQMLVSVGRFESARAALEEGAKLAKQWKSDSEQNLPALRSEIHYGLAVICIDQNDLGEAWNHARKCLETARESHQPTHIGVANRAIGDVLTVMKNVPDADRENFDSDPDTYYQTALKTLREMHAEAELGHTLLAHGRSLAKRGRRLNAARQIQQAMIIFTRLDMVTAAAKAAKAQLEVTA